MKKYLLGMLLVFVLVGAGCSGDKNDSPSDSGENQGNEEEPQNPEPTPVTEVQIYLIALSDGSTMGPVGCGDSAVAVTRLLAKSTTEPLRTALEELFSIQTRDYGQSGLSHTLWSSRLKVDQITETATAVKVELSGPMLLGGTCDNPRVEAQMMETIKYYAPGKEIVVTLDGKPLADALSLK